MCQPSPMRNICSTVYVYLYYSKVERRSLSPPFFSLCPAILCPDYRGARSVKLHSLQCAHCQPCGAPLPDATILSLACSSRQGNGALLTLPNLSLPFPPLVIFNMYLSSLLTLVQKVTPTHPKPPSRGFSFLCIAPFVLN